jgi:hypothetical protein
VWARVKRNREEGAKRNAKRREEREERREKREEREDDKVRDDRETAKRREVRLC